MKKRLFTFVIVGLITWLFLLKFYRAKNHDGQNHPYYSGHFSLGMPARSESLTVVSYNIWFADRIDLAISDIRAIQSGRELDILLLQEMDETGTERIARELQFNYAYFPAAIEPTYAKNFGNAILSRWPISDSQKLILPHKSLSNHMNRIATKATIHIHDTDILVYSIHTESIFTLPRFRRDQYQTVISDISPGTKLVVVGGDFNSFTAADAEGIEKVFGEAGFSRTSKTAGYTISKFGIQGPTDHIYAKGFAVKEAGKLTGATASDHLPIWVTLVLQ